MLAVTDKTDTNPQRPGQNNLDKKGRAPLRPMAGETLKFFLRAGLEKFLWLVRYSNTSYWLYFQNGKKDFLESN